MPAKNRLDCPLGGDIENNCADCIYAGEYHFKNGECVKRELMRTFKEVLDILTNWGLKTQICFEGGYIHPLTRKGTDKFIGIAIFRGDPKDIQPMGEERVMILFTEGDHIVIYHPPTSTTLSFGFNINDEVSKLSSCIPAEDAEPAILMLNNMIESDKYEIVKDEKI